MKKLLFIFFSLWCLNAMAQNVKQLTIGNNYSFEIKDGSNRSGRLDSLNTVYYYINNPSIGVDRISIKSVSKVKAIKLNKDGYFSNPHYSRYFFGPSAIPHPKGEVYWNNIWLEYNTIQYGVTDNFSVGMGGLLFTSLSGYPTLLPNAKYSFKLNEKSHIAVGGLMLVINTSSKTSSASLPFVVYTYGDSEANISFGGGWAHEKTSGWSNRPTGYIAGIKRVARNWVVQGEAYLLNNSTANTILLTTLRNIKPTSSWDFGAMILNFDGERSAVPIIGYTIKF
ncbi:MAG: hypothetical protein NTY43_07630 [Bacteroidetes bacterium]|nr:hypothetical protein [Bacteroidota bacterium]